jgi:hypothetical protein
MYVILLYHTNPNLTSTIEIERYRMVLINFVTGFEKKGLYISFWSRKS